MRGFVPVLVEYRAWQESLPDRERWFPGFLDRSGLRLDPYLVPNGKHNPIGVFALRPDGTLLATPVDHGSYNANPRAGRNKDHRKDFLLEALAAWNALPESERKFEGLNPDFPPLDSFWANSVTVPQGSQEGTILQTWTRSLGPSDSARHALDGKPPTSRYFELWNTDFFWLEDPHAVVPREPEEGVTYRWPSWLETRLARFHLVDSVSGLTLPFPASDIDRSEFYSRVIRVTPETVEIEVFGKTAVNGRYPVHRNPEPSLKPEVVDSGLETDVRGTGIWLVEEDRFQSLSFAASGKRWGGGPIERGLNPEQDLFDLEPTPIGIFFELVHEPDTVVVPPYFAWNRGDGADYWAH